MRDAFFREPGSGSVAEVLCTAWNVIDPLTVFPGWSGCADILVTYFAKDAAAGCRGRNNGDP